jgi:streptogramin lyase
MATCGLSKRRRTRSAGSPLPGRSPNIRFQPRTRGQRRFTQGSDGNLWFIEASTTNIGRITTSGTITEYSNPNLNQAAGITLGPDSNVWFSYESGVGKITPIGAITLYPVNFTYFPAGIVTGPDGNLWFANLYASGARPGILGKITISGAITQVPISTGFATAAMKPLVVANIPAVEGSPITTPWRRCTTSIPTRRSGE